MNTSFPPVFPRADKTAAANAVRRAAVTKADAEKEAQFQDLLSDRKTHGADGAASDDSSRVMANRRAAIERAAGAEATDRANPPSQPVEAVSVQQAMLAPPTRVDQDAKKVAAGEPGGHVAEDANTGLTANGTAWEARLNASTSPIEPHGPPVPIVDASADQRQTAGVKPSLIEPYSPPVIDDGELLATGGIKAPYVDPTDTPAPADGDRVSADTVKPSPVAPHDPPPAATDDPAVRATTATSGQVKPPVIRPHGPVEPTPTVQAGGQADATSQSLANATRILKPGVVSPDDRVAAPGGASSTTVPMSVDRANPAVPPTPANGLARNEYPTKLPIPADNPTDTPSPAQATTANAFRVTTAAQVQFTANPAVGALANPANAEATALSASGAANLADRVAQILTSRPDRDSDDASQVTEQERITNIETLNGTATAKKLDNMMAYPSTLETATGRTAGFTADADVFETLGSPDGWSNDSLRGRAKDGDAAGASVAPTFMMDASTALPTPFAVAASAAPSTGIVQVDRMEALLQTVQHTAEQVRFNGTGQVELRVRLAGVADNVTVRVHLNENKQAQVSFQTGSPELRAALEQGWNDLTAITARTEESSPASVSDLSSARATINPAPTDSYREGRRTSTAPVSATSEQSTRRWSGYA